MRMRDKEIEGETEGEGRGIVTMPAKHEDTKAFGSFDLFFIKRHSNTLLFTTVMHRSIHKVVQLATQLNYKSEFNMIM